MDSCWNYSHHLDQASPKCSAFQFISHRKLVQSLARPFPRSLQSNHKKERTMQSNQGQALAQPMLGFWQKALLESLYVTDRICLSLQRVAGNLQNKVLRQAMLMLAQSLQQSNQMLQHAKGFVANPCFAQNASSHFVQKLVGFANTLLETRDFDSRLE